MLANYLAKYKSGISILIIILFCSSNLIWKSNILSRTANKASIILDFFSETFHGIGEGVKRVVGSYSSYQNIKEERDLLREKLHASRELKVKVKELQRENIRLLQLLKIPPVVDFPVIQAEVISQDPDNWFRTIIINKGSNDGVSTYMPVMAVQVKRSTIGTHQTEKLVQAVVGKVIQVNPNSSRILPIVDKHSRLGIRLSRTNHWAMLMGKNSKSELPQLDYLSLSVFAKLGDEIVTSGGEGIFPKRLLVGYIGKNVERLGGFQRTDVIPAIDFQKLDYVYIIKKKWDKSKFKFKSLTVDSITEE